MTLQSLYCIFISLSTQYFLFEGCIVMCMYRCILNFACFIVIPKRAQHELWTLNLIVHNSCPQFWGLHTEKEKKKKKKKEKKKKKNVMNT